MPNNLQNFEYETVSGGIRIIRYVGPDATAKVIVPAIINGLPVTEIGDWAFYEKTRIQVVDLPWTLKVIGEQSFRDCSSLRRINIPEGVRVIDHAGFKMCSELEPLVLPQSLELIGEDAFEGCQKLIRVEFRSMHTQIHPSAFKFHPEMTFVCFRNSSARHYRESYEPDHPIHCVPFPNTILD